MPRMNEEDSGTNSQGVSTDGRITLLRVVKATRKFFGLWGFGGGGDRDVPVREEKLLVQLISHDRCTLLGGRVKGGEHD
jgi:hypothetical protein